MWCTKPLYRRRKVSRPKAATTRRDTLKQQERMSPSSVFHISSAQEYANEFQRQMQSNAKKKENPRCSYAVNRRLIGRICKTRPGNCDSDTGPSLTDCIYDRTCFFMGSDGLEKLLHIGANNPVDILLEIG